MYLNDHKLTFTGQSGGGFYPYKTDSGHGVHYIAGMLSKLPSYNNPKEYIITPRPMSYWGKLLNPPTWT